MVAPFADTPSRFVRSTDGTRVALFSAGLDGGSDGRPPLLLVHGTTADHRTWRVVAPSLAAGHAVHAIDRRGRGASGDGPEGGYAIGCELDDVAQACEAIAALAGRPVDVIGHSLGGRIALGASLRTRSIRRIVAYESAPAGPVRRPGERDALLDALRADLAAGDNDRLLARFMAEAVGMSPGDLAAFRADPIWALRAAAAPTIVRELEAAEAAPEVGLEALAGVAVPVLQLVGSETSAPFRQGAIALQARLRDGRLQVIDGARHAAHHTHPDAFLARVEAFLAG